MNVRPALLATATLAASGICLALGRWGAEGNRELAALLREVQRGEELHPDLEAGRRREEAKRALAAEVVAGRMALREGAGHFRRLDEANPGFIGHVLAPPHDEEFFCASVLSFAWGVLTDQQRYATAARWYAEVFTAHPQLLAGPRTDHRYRAACAALHAGCGQGRDADNLDEESRAGFRRQARDWLRADLEARRRLLGQEPGKAGPTVAHDMRGWLWDTQFARVRGPEALGPAARGRTRGVAAAVGGRRGHPGPGRGNHPSGTEGGREARPLMSSPPGPTRTRPASPRCLACVPLRRA
jgi:hypothetical protein